jgi:hypothetical protein
MAQISSEAIAASTTALQAGDAQAALGVRNSEFGQESGVFDDSIRCTIEYILCKTPQALADCPQPVLAPVRIAAAMMELWGTNRLRDVTSAADTADYRLERSTIAHMLLSHASFLRSLADFRRVGISRVRLLAARLPDDCRTCRAADGKAFCIDVVPELPLVRCRCKGGCRVIVITDYPNA